MKIVLHLVVILLNFNVYLYTYERFKVVQVSSIHFMIPIWFWKFWGSSYPITLFYTFMESHDDYVSFHGSVAQFQHVLAEICVIEICLSSIHSFQDNNFILQCRRSIWIQLPCSTHWWKDILILLLLVMVLSNSSLYWHKYVNLKGCISSKH